jgi:AAA domain
VRARLDVRAEDLAELSADQQRAVANIATSPWLVQPLQAPAGAGKTHSLKALRAAAHRTRKQVLVLPPTGIWGLLSRLLHFGLTASGETQVLAGLQNQTILLDTRDLETFNFTPPKEPDPKVVKRARRATWKYFGYTCRDDADWRDDRKQTKCSNS